MLNHGGADDNVHYQHTMLFTKASQTSDSCLTQAGAMRNTEDSGRLRIKQQTSKVDSMALGRPGSASTNALKQLDYDVPALGNCEIRRFPAEVDGMRVFGSTLPLAYMETEFIRTRQPSDGEGWGLSSRIWKRILNG